MNTKTFTVLVVIVIAIGGLIGGGLVLTIGQDDDAGTDATVSQQRIGGGQRPAGGIQGGQFSGAFTGDMTEAEREALRAQLGGAFTGDMTEAEREALRAQFSGAFTGDMTEAEREALRAQFSGATAGGGFTGTGGGLPGNILNGTVGAVDGNLITVTTDSGETQVILGDDSTVLTFDSGTVGDLSFGDRVLVIYSGDVESGGPVDALSVVVNQPERCGDFDRAGFGGGNFGGGGGFGGRGFLNGTVGAVDGNVLTVATDSGETLVSLGDDLVIQIYETATAGDLSPGDRVLVIVSGDVESGEPVVAASVIVNPPEGGGLFGAGGFGSGGFGGRPPRP